MSEFKRSFLFFAASVLVLYLAVATLGTLGYITNRHRSQEGQKASVFLCAQRENIVDRMKTRAEKISENQEFLDSGRKVPGISNKDIIDNINSLKLDQSADLKTLKTGRILDCK